MTVNLVNFVFVTTEESWKLTWTVAYKRFIIVQTNHLFYSNIGYS